MKKRQRKKNRKNKAFLSLGRTKMMAAVFWPAAIKGYKERLASPALRKSKDRRRFTHKLRRTEFFLWQHDNFWVIRNEAESLLVGLTPEERDKRDDRIYQEVETRRWQEYRRNLYANG